MPDPVTAVVGGGAVLGGVLGGVGAAKSANAAKDAAALQKSSYDAATAEQARQYDLTREDTLKQQEQQRADFMPWLQTGQAANKELARLLGLTTGDNTINANPLYSNLENMPQIVDGTQNLTDYNATGALLRPFSMGDFMADPGYAFTLSEGQKALERANAAKGKYFSGQAIKGLSRYNQDMASNEFQNAYNRYNTNMSNIYNRLAGISGTGQTTAQNLGNQSAQANQVLANAGQNYSNNIGANLIGGGNAMAASQIGQANAWNTGLQNFGNNAMTAALIYGMRN